jgi:hypothetical protein
MKLLIWPSGKMSFCSSVSRVQMNQMCSCRPSFARPLRFAESRTQGFNPVKGLLTPLPLVLRSTPR